MSSVLYGVVCSLSLACALPGRAPAVARLYTHPDQQADVIALLPARTALNIQVCQGGNTGWCRVTALNKTGWIPRKQVYAIGRCRDLMPVGFMNLRRGEASYQRTRDPDGNGVGCDRLE